MSMADKFKSSTTCPNCGAKISKDSLFCSKCGEKIEIISEEEPKEDDFLANPFIHEADRKSLKILKSIPGFDSVVKKFMKIYSEKENYIINLSSNLKLSEEQMPEIYNLLPPICKKLNIEIPELYLELDVVPNAYTYGDTHPFIVITSGLLETMPFELLPTVLAHECGHIACHHTLYTTIARTLINGAGIAGSYFGLGTLISVPLQIALYQWERNSELSADRAATFYNSGSDNVIELCMRFAGCDKDLNYTVSKDLFMKQAQDSLEVVQSSKWNKTLEFIILANSSHPFNSVRANESYKWSQSDEFKALLD